MRRPGVAAGIAIGAAAIDGPRNSASTHHDLHRIAQNARPAFLPPRSCITIERPPRLPASGKRASSHLPVRAPMLALVILAGLWAGLQNTLAGGGSFVTLPALIVSGMSPLSANITSTVALFPAQVTTGWASRNMVRGVGKLSFRAMFAISVVGGALGGLLLLKTPSSIFSRLVPWLVLFATIVFAWGSFFRKPGEGTAHLGTVPAAFSQFMIAIYGGYFGGGLGFLMMAVLTMAGLSPRHAMSTKNALAGVMNASAVVLFLTSPHLHWGKALALGGGAIVGGLLGTWALHRVNERVLRIGIVCIGALLTIGLFVKPI